MNTEKKGTEVIVAAIFLFMIVAIPTGQAPPPAPDYPEPDLAWHNPTNYDVTDLAVGDLTSNGGADVAFIDYEPPSAFVVYGNDGKEYWKDSYVGGLSIAVGDVDGDGKNEVVVGGYNNNPGTVGITVYEDNGTFKFFYKTDSWVTDIEIGCIDNDGTNDIVACDPAGDGWIYVINSSGENVTGWPVSELPGAIEDIAIGNLDENPRLDIAAISQGVPGTLYVFNSTGDLMWSNGTVFGRSVEIGNVDSDPEAEVVIGDYSSKNVLVYDGDTGLLEYSFSTNYRQPTEVELGDLDGDRSDLEIAVITGIAVDDTIFAIDIDAAGQVNEMWSFSIDWTPNYCGEPLAIGDVDGDNKNEVIALSDSDGNKVWAFDGLDGNGDGLGDVVWMYELPFHPNDVEVGDVDNDGDMDVIVGTDHEGLGSVYALFTKEQIMAPTLSLTGLIALVSLLAAIAAVAIVRKRR